MKTAAILVVAAAAVGLATAVLASGDDAARHGWRVVDESADAGNRSTGTCVTGTDDGVPVAGRVRLVAPPGVVSVSAYVECERRRPSPYVWSTGGNQWRRVPSTGEPIVLDLPFARNLAGTGEMYRPTACRWVVSARGGAGNLSLALEIKEE